jgi:hypothetical protein
MTRSLRELVRAPDVPSTPRSHTLHALPNDVEGELPGQLLEIAHRTASTHLAAVIARSNSTAPTAAITRRSGSRPWTKSLGRYSNQRAWTPSHPPSSKTTQEAISWLSRAIAELDEGSEEAPTSLAETLARLLAVWTFTDAALRHRPSA